MHGTVGSAGTPVGGGRGGGGGVGTDNLARSIGGGHPVDLLGGVVGAQLRPVGTPDRLCPSSHDN